MRYGIFLSIKVILILLLVGCKMGNNSTTVTQNKNPIAKIVVDITSADSPPLEVKMNADNSYDEDGQIVNYNWDFGDGTTGTGTNLSHIYTKADNFTIVLTVTDNDGATSSDSIVITISCDIIHKGDLIIEGNEVFEISDCIYCQYGNIFVKNIAQLIVNNSELRLIQPDFQEYGIQVDSSAFIENSQLTSNYSFYVNVFGNITLENCIMNNGSRLYTMGRGIASVSNSVLVGIGFQGKSNFSVINSEILDLVDIDTSITDNSTIIISDLHPNYFERWVSNEEIITDGDFSNLALENTNVERWTVRIGGKNNIVEIRDSDLYWLRLGHFHGENLHWESGPTMINNTSIEWFFCGDYYGDSVTFSNVQISKFEINYSHLELEGSVTFLNSTDVIWDSAEVSRTYLIIVKDDSDSPLPKVGLNLFSSEGNLIWSGETNSQGIADITLDFNDSNYQNIWTLASPSLNLTLEISFTSNSPIIFSTSESQ